MRKKSNRQLFPAISAGYAIVKEMTMDEATIQQLKENKRAFCLMPVALQTTALQIGKKHFKCLAINSTPDAVDWDGGTNLEMNSNFVGGLTYRLKKEFGSLKDK